MLIDATKWIGQPRTDAMWGERFPPTAHPDEETMERVRSKWKEYGIKA
jgi:hypothetical protein